MDNRTRVVITVTDEMHKALGRLAARRGATVAGLIRSVMGEWLEEQGEVIDWAVSWGGRRRGVQSAVIGGDQPLDEDEQPGGAATIGGPVANANG